MKNETRRWIILAVGILANMCQGAAYASSVFAKPLITHLGLMTEVGGNMVPDMSKWALAFSFNLACLPLGMLISGKMADAKSPRWVVAVGGCVFGLGMLLTGFAGSLTLVLAFFGIMMGIGSGAAYGAIVATSVRWFPDMRGLAGGLSVGALGIGTFLITPVARMLMESAPEGQTPVLWAFKILGIVFLLLIAGAAFFMVTPEPGYKPAGWEPKSAGGSKSPSANDVNWVGMLKKAEFWVLFMMYACGAFSGLMVISQASPIGQKMANLTPADAVWIVSLMGLANALGRVFWGFVSDKIGRLNSLLTMFAVTAVAMFLLPELAKAKTTLLIDGMIVGACFGGYLGTFPSVCADYFGTKNLTVNYALLFSAFSVAAIAGPISAGKIHTATGTYVNAFIIAGAVSAAGVLLTVIAIFLSRRKANMATRANT